MRRQVPAPPALGLAPRGTDEAAWVLLRGALERGRACSWKRRGDGGWGGSGSRAPLGGDVQGDRFTTLKKFPVKRT